MKALYLSQLSSAGRLLYGLEFVLRTPQNIRYASVFISSTSSLRVGIAEDPPGRIVASAAYITGSQAIFKSPSRKVAVKKTTRPQSSPTRTVRGDLRLRFWFHR